MGDSSHVPAAAQALAVLRALASASGPMSATALARALDLPRSSTYHLLNVLAREGFVVHLPEERRWGLGVATFEVGSAYLRHDPLERLARPLLARLVDELASRHPAVAHLGVLHGRETLYLLKESPARHWQRPVTLVTDVGVRLPAHLTASGRSLLAALPAAQVRALFPDASAFVDRTGAGPASLSQLRRTLGEERRRGWSAEDGEVTPGYGSVAVAAFDHLGRPVAAVGLTVRRESCPPETWPTLAAAAADVAATLTRRLGGTPTPGPTG